MRSINQDAPPLGPQLFSSVGDRVSDRDALLQFLTAAAEGPLVGRDDHDVDALRVMRERRLAKAVDAVAVHDSSGTLVLLVKDLYLRIHVRRIAADPTLAREALALARRGAFDFGDEDA